MLDRESAERFAGWFKALADPTRVQLVSLLATQKRPMSVGEIVEASGVGQSTVSHHLKALAEVRFVLSEAQGTARLYRINDACVACFPSAADVVMGRDVPDAAHLRDTHPRGGPMTDTPDIRETVRRRYAEAATRSACGDHEDGTFASRPPPAHPAG